MLFAISTKDKANHLQVRMDTRPAHIEFLKGLGSKLKAGGPFLDDEGKPNGSLIVIETETKAEAEAIAAQDPYVSAGLFESVEIRAWNWLLKNPELEA
jgi:uncharacterized protein YciI